MSEIPTLEQIHEAAAYSAGLSLAGLPVSNPHAWGTAAHEVWNEEFHRIINEEQGVSA